MPAKNTNPKKAKTSIKNNQNESHTLALRPEDLLALPSRSAVDTKQLVPDGYFKEEEVRIIKRGSKIGHEDSSSHVDAKQFNEKPKVYLGRKNTSSVTASVDELRKEFGFTWKKFGRNFGLGFLLFGIFLVITVSTSAAVVVNMWNNAPSLDRIERKPAESSVLLARDGQTKIYEFYDEERREVIDDVEEIPRVMQLAIISLEDQDFYKNEAGIPWRNLVGASFKCLVSAAENCRGASGIGQQLVKNITKDDDRSIDRKVRELLTAVKLNRESPPEEILRQYLNWVPFGRNAYGVQEASKSYFGRPINARNEKGEFVLTAPEACYLASMVQIPSYYSSGIQSLPEANSQKNDTLVTESDSDQVEGEVPTEEQAIAEEIIPQASIDLELRKDLCLQKLYDLEFENETITEDGEVIRTFGPWIESAEELNTLQNQKVVVTTSNKVANEARAANKIAFVNQTVEDPFPHFREYATQEIVKFLPGQNEEFLYLDGYQITTTIDANMQREVERIIKESEPTIQQYGANNAAAMVMDGKTGEILAMVGSLGYDRTDIKGKVNIPTTPQQPGSSVKPYVYAAAWNNGYNPSTTLVDVKTTWNGNYTPKNFSGGFRGPVTMRQALQGSLNIPAVKALFLVDDDPSQQTKLNTFFDFAESTGLRFPCVDGAGNELFVGKGKASERNAPIERCTVDEANNISQEDVDKAYRGRCFLASALGGCEITMVSHVTGINTFLQEGRLRTATPFKSIVRQGDGEDIYATIQSSENKVYEQRDPTPEFKALSQQVASVMTDNNSRIPEFGSLRFNLVLNDGREVAAKTGTSNGPKDFWTIGGSTDYTVAVWVGKTDNGSMGRTASSSRTAAPIWKEIMTSIHQPVPKGSFNTDLLKSRGGELLTEKQIDERYYRGGKVAINSAEEAEEFKARSIVANRTTLIPVAYSINKIDGKLFVEGKTLESNREVVECNLLVPEFPQPNWSEPVNAFAKNSSKFCTFPESSEQDQVNSFSEPIINTNLNSDSTFTSRFISVNVTPSTSGQTISRIRLSSDSGDLAVSNSSTLSYDASSLDGTTQTITVTAIDNNGIEYTKLYTNVSFIIQSSEQLSISDINGISCTPSSPSAGGSVSCSFNLDTAKSFSSLSVLIGSSPSQGCVVGGGSAICSGVAVPSTPGTYNLVIRINGSPNTSSYEIVVN